MSEIVQEVQLPQRHTSDLSAVFVENHLTLPGNEIPPQYVQRLRTFLTVADAEDFSNKIAALWKDNLKHVEDLKLVLIEFQGKLAAAGHSDVNTQDLEPLSFAQMMEEFGRAKAYYHGGFRKLSPIYKALRAFGKRAKTFQQWLEFIPNDTYGSVVCGSLKLVLTAAARTYELDKLVFDTVLIEIPEMIESMNHYTGVFFRDQLSPELLWKTTQLCNEILLILIGAFRYSLKNKFKHYARHFISDQYRDDLKKQIESAKRCAVELNEEAKRCDRRILVSMAKNVAQLMEERKPPSLNVYVQYHELMSANPSLDARGHMISETMKAQEEGRADQENIQSGLTVSDSRTQRTIDTAKCQGLTAKSLLSLLVFNPLTIKREIEENHLVSHLEEQQVEKLVQANQSQHFVRWLETEERSSILVINGHFDNTPVRSPLSHLCSEISKSYEDAPGVIVLTYFCGLHAEVWDPRSNAAGLLVSLVGQLLSNLKASLDLSFIDQDFEKLIEDDDFESLAQLFLELIFQLPPKTIIFCLIDSISYYETTSRRKDTTRLLATFQELIDDSNHKKRKNPVMKLLITDPARSIYASKYFQAENIMDLWENVDI